MIASLMMYNWPQQEAAISRFWNSIRDRLGAYGIDAPVQLSQTAMPFTVWEDPALVLSQTCGMPYRTILKDKVQLAGTPNYGLAGCPAGYYRSAIIVRADDARDNLEDYATARLALNDAHSQSGFAALYNHVKPMGFWFADRALSGGHVFSARMVADGLSDIAALDAQTWRLIQRYEDFTPNLRVLEYTEPTPGLPFITGPNTDIKLVKVALCEAIDALSADDKETLDLHGLVQISRNDYLAVPTPPSTAAG